MKLTERAKRRQAIERPPHRTFLSYFDWLNRFKSWWLGGVSLTRSIFRVRAALQTLLILLIVLSAAYIMAAFYTQSGEFIVSLSRQLAADGFVISETTNFEEQLITLHGTAVDSVNNINIADIDRDVFEVNGDHNGKNYVAYTFYFKNETGETKNYSYQLRLKNSTKHAEDASWIMVNQNGKMTVYAKESASGGPEVQYSDGQFPFMEYATKSVVVTTEDGINCLQSVPFEANDMICSGVREGIEDQEIDKYTVVIWFEGEDPECTDDIIGGTLELTMKFAY